MKISPVICFASANANPVLLFLSGSGVPVENMVSAVVPLGRSVVGGTRHGIVVKVVVSDSDVSGGVTCGIVFELSLGRTVLIVGANFRLIDRTFALWAHMWPMVDALGFGG